MCAEEKQTRASRPFSLNPTGTLSRRVPAQFVCAVDIYVQIRKGRLLVDRQPSGAYLFNDTTNVLDGIQSLRTHKIDRLDLRICQPHQEGH